MDAIWERLGIASAIGELLKTRHFETDVERTLFALVANRAINPTSKLSAVSWMKGDVVIKNLSNVTDDHAYRAMDFLLDADEAIQKEVFFSVANLLNLEVDLLFFDTTSTYFEADEDDFRKYGNTKDHRDDRPQVVVGLAVTREGIPVRSWVFQGNTADMALVERIKDDLRDWKLGRVVMVVDRGFTLRGEPALHATSRRRLHRRRKTSLRQPVSGTSTVESRALSGGKRQPQGKRDRGRRWRET
nr:IS1634 family transposase [Candidatus Aquicultor secundus]